MSEKQSKSAGDSLALCMIVRDEADCLDACLDSVADSVDAIYITDTGSKDTTREIASRRTPHLREISWENDFSAARNASIRDVEEDWILILDADDRFPDGEAAKLKPAIRNSPHSALALSYEIMPDHTPEPGLKLFRNHIGVAFEGLIHESIRNSLTRRPQPAVGACDIRLLHSGYRPTDLPRKIDRNRPLLEREFRRADRAGDRMQRLSVGVDLANARIAAGETAAGERELRRLLDDLLENGPPADGRWELSPLVYLLWLCFEQDRCREAVELCRLSGNLYANHPVFPLYRGMARLRDSDFAGALADLRRFETNLADGPPPFSVPKTYVGGELWNMVGNCCLGLGDAKQAAAYFQRAVSADPGNREYQVRLQLARLRQHPS